ncbi:MAG: hypothetical protein AAB723_01125, partial [Patescibacteria group bacterium]
APCDQADDTMQCVSPAEAERLQQERNKKYGNVFCTMCPTSAYLFRCVCQNDSCVKTNECEKDEDCYSKSFDSKYKCKNGKCVFSCVAEGEQGGTETNVIENRKLYNCCLGLDKVDLTTLWEGVCENASGTSIDTLFTCIKCGDGVCGAGENKCNCPQDCGIKIGRLDNIIGQKKLDELQSAVDLRIQPWRVQQDMVFKVDGLGYGFTANELENAKNIFTAGSAGVVQYEVFHNSVVYTVSLIQPVPGEGKIWMISEISKK